MSRPLRKQPPVQPVPSAPKRNATLVAARAPLLFSVLQPILRRRLFWVSLVAKLVAGSLLASFYLRDLFIPFLNHFVSSGFGDPWVHAASNGVLNAFPYPPGMLYLLTLPRLLAAPFLPAGDATVTFAHLFVARLPLLVADLTILATLVSWFPGRRTLLLHMYWCSPIVFYVNYCHGQLDILPTATMLLSLHFYRQRQITGCAAMFALALGTKSHNAVALPFLAMMVWQEKGTRGLLRWLAIFVGVYLALLAPHARHPEFWKMVFGTTEQLRIFALVISFAGYGYSFQVVPAMLILIGCRFAAFSRRNDDSLILYLGFAFGVFILCSPPAPGYFLWSLPFVIYAYSRSHRPRTIFYWAYVFAYVFFYSLGDRESFVDQMKLLPHALQRFPTLPAPARDLLFTVMETSLLGIFLDMLIFAERSSRLASQATERATQIGIAGDSGSGKDRFIAHLERLLGENRVTVTSGDDYHKWPRGDSNWRRFSHLDVRANDLYAASEDANRLANGESIVKRTYDHGSGTFLEGQTVDPNGYLVFSGLHALALRSMRDLYDLKVFLDPDERLRRNWKVRRDARERGYTAEQVLSQLAQRESDRQKYILPQRDHADLVVSFFSLKRIETHTEETDSLGLQLLAMNSFNLSRVIEKLQSVPTLSVEHDPFESTSWQRVVFTGEVSGHILTQIAQSTISNLGEVTWRPVFPDDLEGCAQLILLCCLCEQMTLNRSGHVLRAER